MIRLSGRVLVVSRILLVFVILETLVVIGFNVLYYLTAPSTLAWISWSFGTPHFLSTATGFAAISVGYDTDIMLMGATLSAFILFIDASNLMLIGFGNIGSSKDALLTTRVLVSAWVGTDIMLVLFWLILGRVATTWRRRVTGAARRIFGSNEKAEDLWVVTKDVYFLQRMIKNTWTPDFFVSLLFYLLFSMRVWNNPLLIIVLCFQTVHLVSWPWVKVACGSNDSDEVSFSGAHDPSNLTAPIILTTLSVIFDVMSAFVQVWYLFGSAVSADVAFQSIGLGLTLIMILTSTTLEFCLVTLQVHLETHPDIGYHRLEELDRLSLQLLQVRRITKLQERDAHLIRETFGFSHKKEV